MCQHCDNYNKTFAEFSYKYETSPNSVLEELSGDRYSSPNERLKELRKYIRRYLTELDSIYKDASQKLVDKIVRELAKLPPTVSESKINEVIEEIIEEEWRRYFGLPQQEATKETIPKAYRAFRTDKKALEGAKKKPNAKFTKQDRDTRQFFIKSDNYYLGKFIRDKDTQKAIRDFIQENYKEGKIPLKGNSKAEKAFKRGFRQVLVSKDWKLNQIASTTMNRMRNDATIQYMEQAEVMNYTIVGVSDKRQCHYCKSMQGKTFSVVRQIKRIAERNLIEPQDLGEKSPFLTTLKVEKVRRLTNKDLESLGFTTPPFHPLCRDIVVVS